MAESKTRVTLRHLSEVVAPGGWKREINLDLPIWRYLLVTSVFVGGYVCLRSLLGGPFDLGDWGVCSATAVICLGPVLLRKLHLRRKRKQLAEEQRRLEEQEAYERGYPDRSK